MNTAQREATNTTLLDVVAQLCDADILARVMALAVREREVTTALVAHLTELDSRRLYLARGCASLFTYCTQVLRLSEHAAYHRIQAARAVRRFPVILDLLDTGAVSLTTVTLVAPHLTPTNHREVLRAAAGRSKREVEALVVSLHPQPLVPTVVRRLPQRRVVAAATNTAAVVPAHHEAERAPTAAQTTQLTALPAVVGTSAQARPSHRPVVQPLAPERYKVQFTASAATVAKLRRAQDLLRHQIPNGDLGEVIDRALTTLLRQAAARKTAVVERPRGDADRDHFGARPGEGERRVKEGSARTVPRSQHIPASVRRTVWARDGGQCAFVAPDGRRCSETAFLESYHVMPYSRGGQGTVDNIALRCRSHNGYEAVPIHGTKAGWEQGGPAEHGDARGGEGILHDPTRPGAS